MGKVAKTARVVRAARVARALNHQRKEKISAIPFKFIYTGVTDVATSMIHDPSWRP
jgi:hypothetical protein